MSVPVRDLPELPLAGRGPTREFSWRRGQRHRSGLEYLVSTERQHGHESLAEARLLLMLDFAGGAREVLSQPLRLRFWTGDGPVEHFPDFLAVTDSGIWLIDVRPMNRIGERDEVKFAATAEVAALHGWGYVVVGGWRPQMVATVDWFSSQRRPLIDRLGMVETLLGLLSTGPATFAALADATACAPIARAFLLHLLWRRRVGMNLGRPLTDATLIRAADFEARRVG
ncbi:TnsA-like heteromeric transposase endonuclease subunit (plasmid) [Nocardia sp. NBC_01377]|uniref:TnsA-like heteromeric transposase endonuclease subunit n=1 Tax=Nocardia sp. NBC_01377 TaxID=2903595 RepID=UPI002F918E84